MDLVGRFFGFHLPWSVRCPCMAMETSKYRICILEIFQLIVLRFQSENNVRFAMSQEIAQDEGEAEDYEFGNLSNRPVQAGDEDEDEDERGGLMGQPPGYDENGRREGGIRLGGEDRLKDENVVFALEDDDEDAVGDIGRNGREGKGKGDYRDMEEDDYGRKGKYD